MHRVHYPAALSQLLQSPDVPSIAVDGHHYYAVIELIQALDPSLSPEQAERFWHQAQQRDPALARLVLRAEISHAQGPMDTLPLAGVMHLVQLFDASSARRIRTWMSTIAAQAIEERQDPELAVQRLRQNYQEQGFSRRWIDQRLRSISGRQELTREWHRRGATDSAHFRALTNRLAEELFGADVARLRRQLGIHSPLANLRDHLNEMDLNLLGLAETTAALLHRTRNSLGIDALLADVAEAATIARQTRQAIAQAVDQHPAPASAA